MFSNQPNRLFSVVSVCGLLLGTAAFIKAFFPHTTPALGAPLSQQASIARTFNYQGILRQADGTLVPNGEYAITLKIYQDVIGGEPLHTEVKPNVPVRDGVFNVVLGDEVPMGAEVLAIMPRFIGITVGTDAEMAPRQRIHPAPWALIADSANTANTANTANSANTANVANALIPNPSIEGNLQLNGNLTVDGVRPILTRRFYHVGDNANFNTGISVFEYRCTTGAFHSGYHDLPENSDYSRAIVYTYPKNDTWWAQAEFPSHGPDENPIIDVICFRWEFVDDPAGVAIGDDGILSTDVITDTSGAPGGAP